MAAPTVGGVTAPPLLRRLLLWAATASGLEVAVVALTWTAIAVAAYVGATTVLYTAALAARPALADRLGAVTPAIGRRLARRLVAAALLTGTWAPAGTATAAVPPPGLRVPAARDAATMELPIGRVADVPAPVVASPAATAVVRVRAGEHLWSIAGRHLADARGIPVAELPVADVARYWRRVVDANAPSLPSGDPDLVHPGDEIRLPPLR